MGLRPDKDLADLISAGLGGVLVLHGPVRPAKTGVIPQECVFIVATGGQAPEAFNGETIALRRPNLQIRTRAKREKYEDGLALTRAVRDIAHYASIAGYLDFEVQESEPNYLGEDGNGLPEWSMNVKSTFVE